MVPLTSWLVQWARNTIFLGNLWSVVGPFRLLIHILQGIFTILQVTPFSTPKGCQ